MKKPNILLLVDRKHHSFFFNEISPTLTKHNNVEIIETAEFHKYTTNNYKPTNPELEKVVNYYYKKKISRTTLLRWIKFLRHIFRHYLMFVAKNYFNNYCRYFENKKIDCIGVWSGNAIPLAAAIVAARRTNIKTVFFENGALPNTTAMDTKGINFQNSVPRDPDFYLSLSVPHNYNEPKSQLIKRESKKIIKDTPVKLPDNYLFIPFQVFGDSQIILFSPWIDKMELLTELVIRARDEAGQNLWLVFKEHPTCKNDYSVFKKRLKSPNVLFANGNSTQELIENSQGVITINSSVGIESLLLGKKVITLGQAFYNIEGLVLHADNFQELIECIKKVQTWNFDNNLKNSFLSYLDEYYIKGSWREPTAKTIEIINKRFDTILMN